MGSPERSMGVLPKVHTIAGKLKRMIDGTHGGQMSSKHTFRYVAAFTFRYNNCGFLGEALERTVLRIAQTTPLPHKALIR